MVLSRHLRAFAVMIAMAFVIPAIPVMEAEAQPVPRRKKMRKRKGPPGGRPVARPKVRRDARKQVRKNVRKDIAAKGRAPRPGEVGRKTRRRMKRLTPDQKRARAAKLRKDRAERKAKRMKRRQAWKKMPPARRKAWRAKRRAALKDPAKRKQVRAEERRKHATRMSKIKRLEAIGRAEDNPKLIKKAGQLRAKEMKRHKQAVGFITSAP